MSGGAGGMGMRGGSGGFMNQFISPGAAGMGPNQYGTGMLNGGPQANFNGMNIGNKIPFKGGTTEKQMNDNVRAYWAQDQAADNARNGTVSPSTGMVMDANRQWHDGADRMEYDPRRSPDVAAPWRINMPYKGPVNGGTPMPPNPTGAAYGSPNMYAGGNPNFNEAAPGYNGLLGRASYR